MKLNTKLKVSFVVMFLLPIVLCSIVITGIMVIQNKGMQTNYEVEGVEWGSNLAPASMLSRITNSIYDEIRREATENPERFNDQKYLQELSANVEARFSNFILRKNNEIVFSDVGESQSLTDDMLPDYGEGDNNSGYNVYYGDEYQCLVKQYDFTDKAGNCYSAFILTETVKIVPQMKLMLMELLLAVIIILIMTSLLLTLWMHSSIVKPIMRLKLAAQNIQEGNLDFELPVEYSGDEIASLTKDFEEMRIILKNNAEEKIKAESEEKELIRNISHDLKTPLTAIKGYVEGLLDGVADTPEKQDRYLKMIYNKANELDALINELSLYTNITNNAIPYEFHRVSVKDYFNDCMEEVRADLLSHNMTLNYNNYCAEDVKVVVDPDQLKRVINNIVTNAIKYTDKEEGHIDISIEESEKMIKVSINDDGRGIDKESLPHIFDRTYRADSARRSRGGSGLGLAICKKIVEEHGGKIWATSKKGEGTTIYFTLKKYIKEENKDEQNTDN